MGGFLGKGAHRGVPLPWLLRDEKKLLREDLGEGAPDKGDGKGNNRSVERRSLLHAGYRRNGSTAARTHGLAGTRKKASYRILHEMCSFVTFEHQY